jgi:hypothetical protein
MICVHDEDVTLFKTDEGVFREDWGESFDIFCHFYIMEIENFSLLPMTDFNIVLIIKTIKIHYDEGF